MKSVGDVQSALKELFADTVQEMLEAELDTTLVLGMPSMTPKTSVQRIVVMDTARKGFASPFALDSTGSNKDVPVRG